MTKQPLYGLTLSELREIAASLDMPRHTAGQIAAWLYKKRATDIAQMTDLSLKNRALLEEKYEVGLTAPTSVAESADGTRKYLFPTAKGHAIEAAMIPDGERATLCVSSQAGCRMGCTFCMTGRQGLQHNLTAGEILNQMRSITESEQLTNIVYMGMGEPLDNLDEALKSLEILTADWGYGWSPTRITVSTIGILPQLRQLLDRSKVHVAVSLHTPFAAERAELMPMEKAFPAKEIVALLKEYDFSGQRRVSFEYIVFQGINDSPAHVRELARLLDGLKCRINLIRFHAIPDSPLRSPDDIGIERFRDAIAAKGIITTIRSSRGEDIQAACGLLSTSTKPSTKP
ncbi:MAG: 23S rRNA (adenine(2503)-C(2))-methyltransferase RlmN [Rikenellaceae bacterium]|nr:23S rRNA (adenine(2503)-C(2))-methyltransferase RlmN [Rikenellaceae bacterium]MCL2692015.1 23S rRNA (adenine(2503)-C(2))-methyltransferase RlmN [Rikenellaceae bacterium]